MYDVSYQYGESNRVTTRGGYTNVTNIQNALDSLSKGRTTLIIAHKISTIKNSDKIVVLDSGNVVDQGTHEELISKCKIYQSLYQMENK